MPANRLLAKLTGKMTLRKAQPVGVEIEERDGDSELEVDDLKDRPGSTKRGGTLEQTSPPKSRRGEEVSFVESMLRSLLADTQSAILKAQDVSIKAAMAQFEQRQEQRFCSLEETVAQGTVRHETAEKKLQGIESHVAKLEEGGSTTVSSDRGAEPDKLRRRLTLVLGGFPVGKMEEVIPSMTFRLFVTKRPLPQVLVGP